MGSRQQRGALLVASGLLAEAGPAIVLGLLAASYGIWGVALRPALAANLVLLERTGAGTSLPSKICHDLAAASGLGRAARRLAASAGYVGTELVKEAPYYLGAAGAVLMTEAVTSTEAVLFLAGANLGAAAYEAGFAGLVRLFPARRATPYASFEVDWSARAYLSEYYATVEPDERCTLAFLADAARGLAPARSILIFGAGPTLHHVFPFAAKARAIDITDVLPANLDEIDRWIAADPAAHDWRPFIRHVLRAEGASVSDAAVAGREAQARLRIRRLWPSDLRDPLSLAPARLAHDVVVSAYCADSATDDLATWALYMHRIAGLVRPGGSLVIAALLHSRGYRVGGRLFPSADVGEEDMRALLARWPPGCGSRRTACPSRHGTAMTASCWPRPRCGELLLLASCGDWAEARRVILRHPVSP